MAAVAVVVVGLLERAQDEAVERPGAMPGARDPVGHRGGRLTDRLRRLRRRQRTVGHGRRRHPEGGELLDQPLDGHRIRALVYAVERRDPVLLQKAGDLLVGGDHEMLDQAVGLRRLLEFGLEHVTVAREGEGRLGGFEHERRGAHGAQRVEGR